MPESHLYDIFLSYSSKDRAVVHELAEKLKSDGLRVWLDAWVIKPGDNIPAAIEHGLEKSRVLVLCMSENAFGSDWPRLESGTFRFRDPLNRQRRFVPVRLDEAQVPGTLAQFLYVDYRSRDSADYSRLLEACRSTSPTGIEGLATALEPTKAVSARASPAPMGSRPHSQHHHHSTHRWDLIIAFTAGVIAAAVIFMSIRADPPADSNRTLIIRIVLAGAMAVFGAAVPGLLNVKAQPRKREIRAGSAIALAAIAFFFAPYANPVPPVSPPPHATEFGNATAQLASVVRAAGTAIESQLRSSRSPNSRTDADRFHEAWRPRQAVVEQLVQYSDRFASTYYSASSDEQIGKLADDLLAIASAAGMVMPSDSTASIKADLAAMVYNNILQTRTAPTIAESLGPADRTLAGIARYLESQSKSLRELIESSRDNARDQAEADSIALHIDQQFGLQVRVVEAADAAVTEWSRTHNRLVQLTGEPNPVSLDSLRQATSTLRERIEQCERGE